MSCNFDSGIVPKLATPVKLDQLQTSITQSQNGWTHAGRKLTRRPDRDLLTGMQVQRPIEVHVLSAWMQTDNWRLTPRCPDRNRSRLQIQACLVFSKKHAVRRILRDIYRFFSSCSSNSAILASERDLYPLAGRWRLKSQRSKRL